MRIKGEKNWGLIASSLYSVKFGHYVSFQEGRQMLAIPKIETNVSISKDLKEASKDRNTERKIVLKTNYRFL